MDTKNIVYNKSEDFAVRIINLCKYLVDDKKEFVMSKQILRSGTNIVANLSEAECAISKNDWVSKVYISLKETSETACWLRLLFRTDFITETQFKSLYSDCIEIKRILSSSTKTAKSDGVKNAKQ